jgi:uncharacterized protein (TIGR02147 family)
MKKNIFEYKNYKSYMLEKIQSFPGGGRGLRLKMAQYLGCQTAFISQVLNKHVHFSLEQAVKLNQFWEHNKDEGKFFILLLQLERAGSKDLENYFKEEIKEILKVRTNLKDRFKVKDGLDEMNQHIYYSAWYYAAVHMALAIPQYRSAKSISQYLRLPLKLIQEVLSFLVSTGLAVEKGQVYEIGKTYIHLGKESVQIRRHHTNWRNQAIQNIDHNDPNDFHYSSVMSISPQDVPKIKEVLVQAIEECRTIIRSSPEESIHVMNLDFFSLRTEDN